MRRTTLRESYFSWLYDQVGTQRPSRIKLCKELHDIKFRWFVKNDDNRYEDGIQLRFDYIEHEGLDMTHLEVQSFVKGDCTFFEMMVALAKRMNDLTYEFNPQKDMTAKWFVEMLENLRLDNLTDNSLLGYTFATDLSESVKSVTETVINRTYDWYGRGGLFPLKRRPPTNQAEMEIWYQLMLYMDENYG